MDKIERFKKIALLLLIEISTFQLASTQENYIPGYIIKNNADTLFGFVDYRNWEYNPDKIMFKTNIESNPISLTPADIIEFKVEGEIYKSGIINTEVSPTKMEMVNAGSQINIKVDITFLQSLFIGRRSLYYYKNSAGRENFYIKQDSGFELLVFKRYLKKQNDNIIFENNKYLGQLNLYLNDCETIKSELENISYNQNSLIKLFQSYYKCFPSDLTFQKEKEKTRVEIGVLAGVSLTSLEFRGEAFSYQLKAAFKPSINFSSGIFFDLILPRNQGKWSINNEVLFSTYKVKGSYENYENDYNYSVTTLEIGYLHLKINNLVRFKYPIGHLFLFLNCGISNGISISETNHKKEESRFYTTIRVVEELALIKTRKYEQGFILGTGVKFDRFSLEIRYERGNGMSEYTAQNFLTKRYYCLLGYRF